MTPVFRLQLPLAWPYFVSSRFNAPRSYTFAPSKKQLHEGLDFAPLRSATGPLRVYAAQRGVVDKVGYSAQGYGHYVRVTHDWYGTTYVTWYAHLEQILARENTFVAAGDLLGLAGSTGFSTGTHLHLTLQHLGHGLKGYVVDDVIDPESLIVQRLPDQHELWWLADVTIPDGTRLRPGQPFRKTWRIRNAGTLPWRDARLVFTSGDRMNGPDAAPLPDLAPGAEGNITVDLVAPTRPGSVRSTWHGRTAQGQQFDYDLYADIVVEPDQAHNEARFVADVTVPDGTEFKAGQPFRKTWRIRNSGSTTWASGYTLAFFGGTPMNGPSAVPLPRATPGDIVDVSVDLTAPAAPGLVRCTYMPRDPQGRFFPFEMYAEISVVGAALEDGAALVGHVVRLAPGERTRKVWRVKNTGQTRWGPAFSLAFVDGEPAGAPAFVPLPDVAPGADADLEVILTAPALPGSYRSVWQLRGATGKPFGPLLVAPFEVVVPPA